MFVGRLLNTKIKVLAFLSFLAITGITLFKDALELEDAEQAYYSQWLRWGYDDQPPLYTWLQYAVNTIFGVQKVSFSVLRGAIFGAVLLAMAHLSKKLMVCTKKWELAVLVLVFLPVFIDFTFRRLSHTALLCLSVVLSLIVIHRLLQEKTVLNYILLGCILSLGMLCKYNFILFLCALLAAALWDASLRNLLLHRKFLLTLGLMVFLLFPHFNWLFAHEGYLSELNDSIALKTESTVDVSVFILAPLASLVLTLFKFTAPLLGVFLFAFAFRGISVQNPRLDWFAKLALMQILMLSLFFVVLNVQKVEERWLLPLLLPFTIVLVRTVRFKSVRKWTSYLFGLFVSIVVLQVIRTPAEKVLGIPSSVHFGFGSLSHKLNADFHDQDWMLPDVTYAGNVRLLNPHKEILSKDDFSLPKTKVRKGKTIEVVVGAANLNGVAPLGQLLNFGMERDTLYFIE